jgi:hypothetical protein
MLNDKEHKTLITSIAQHYSKAPYLKTVLDIISDVFQEKAGSIADLAINSISTVCSYLDIDTQFSISSGHFSESKGQDKFERLVTICNSFNADQYVNPKGGMEIYNKSSFSKRGLMLSFLNTNNISYEQSGRAFVPNLSIIDVMMFNSTSEIKNLLSEYKLT